MVLSGTLVWGGFNAAIMGGWGGWGEAGMRMEGGAKGRGMGRHRDTLRHGIGLKLRLKKERGRVWQCQVALLYTHSDLHRDKSYFLCSRVQI